MTHETVMRAATVTISCELQSLPPHTHTSSFLFSSEEQARGYFDNRPDVVSVVPDNDSEFFSPLRGSYHRCTDCTLPGCGGLGCKGSKTGMTRTQ